MMFNFFNNMLDNDCFSVLLTTSSSLFHEEAYDSNKAKAAACGDNESKDSSTYCCLLPSNIRVRHTIIFIVITHTVVEVPSIPIVVCDSIKR